MKTKHAPWLADAVFYEIYPQSFCDTNGDGIGDFEGIIQKLDYIKNLGCNALWINPCFDSPFKDAGYDVRDYKKAAPRYGTNEDLIRLFEEAHRRGIHVLLDLVPGHTSEEHPWFIASGKAERNEYSDRYIWTDYWIRGIAGHPYIGGECDRNGTYMLNFFKCQPALNYGFFKKTESWQTAMDDPAALETREAMKDVIRFWLDRGCDGFRVDMAESLVKDDDDKRTGTCALWRDVFEMVRRDYPDAAFVAEWSNPALAVASAGFDMDFMLDHPGNGYHVLMRRRNADGSRAAYFASDGGTSILPFLADYLPRYEASKEAGYISLITCNHDTPRPSWYLTEEERKIAYAFLFTMPGVPFLYYGDEVGMRYLADIPTKEGGYTRTGSRTPMQWTAGKNAGFSSGNEDTLYLPVDPDPGAPNAEAAMADPASLWHVVQDVIALRHAEKDLQADGEFSVVLAEEGMPFLYRRGELLCAVYPAGGQTAEVALPGMQAGAPADVSADAAASDEVKDAAGDAGSCQMIFTLGDVQVEGGFLTMAPGSFAVLKK